MTAIRYPKVKSGSLEREISTEIGGNKNTYRFLLNAMIGRQTGIEVQNVHQMCASRSIPDTSEVATRTPPGMEF